jgi:hypothetical protein
MNDIVSFGLEPFCNCLAPGNWNQAGEDDRTSRFALDCKPADPKGLHPAFKEYPFIIGDSS